MAVCNSRVDDGSVNDIESATASQLQDFYDKTSQSNSGEDSSDTEVNKNITEFVLKNI